MRWRVLWVVAGVACGPGKDDYTLEDGNPVWWSPPLECTPTTFYEDLDGDGFGVSGTGVPGEACRPPLHSAEQDGDCDDRNSTVHPDAPEVCDDRDNDCDGRVDHDDAGGVTDAPIWFQDSDGDGFGSETIVDQHCDPPEGAVRDRSDCDDHNAAIHPHAEEDVDDGVDNNCDGLVDRHGRLSGAWTVQVGEATVPGVRECVVTWLVEGVWAPDICPDCDLAFRIVGEPDPVFSVGDQRTCGMPSNPMAFTIQSLSPGELWLTFHVTDGGYIFDDDDPLYITPTYTWSYSASPERIDWDGDTLELGVGKRDWPVVSGGEQHYLTHYHHLEAAVE